MRSYGRHYGLLASALLVIFAILSERLASYDRRLTNVEMEVALPRWVQTLMAAGDRHLAANLGGFRALVASTQTMSAHNFRIQALVQQDVAWLNPSHEDNYYIAAAILPWNGEIAAAQSVLKLATDGRPFDPLPPFYYGFGELYFYHRPAEGARWIELAASRATSENDRVALKLMAANWYQRGEQPETASQLLRVMANSSRNPSLRAYLQKRIERYDLLIELRDQASEFLRRQGRPLKRIDELVSYGFRSDLPADPLGGRFSLDAKGLPVLHERKRND